MVEIGLTDVPKIGMHGTPRDDRPHLSCSDEKLFREVDVREPRHAHTENPQLQKNSPNS